jgi:hypothetical protein
LTKQTVAGTRRSTLARSKAVSIEQRGCLTLREALIYAGIGHSKAKSLIEQGEWKAYPCGSEIRVVKKSLDDWMLRLASRDWEERARG